MMGTGRSFTVTELKAHLPRQVKEMHHQIDVVAQSNRHTPHYACTEPAPKPCPGRRTQTNGVLRLLPATDGGRNDFESPGSHREAQSERLLSP